MRTPTPEHTETAESETPPPPSIRKGPLHRLPALQAPPPPPIPTPGWLLEDPPGSAAAPAGRGRPAGRGEQAAPANPGAGGAAGLTLGRPPRRGAGRGRRLTFRWRRPARRGTPARPQAGAAGSWGGGVPRLVLTPRAPPPPLPLCLGPPAPLPLPWRAPTSCSRARGASVGEPHGAANPPPRRARPAQSARPPRPQHSPASRGAWAARQRRRGPASARARPMVPGVPAPARPRLTPFLLPPKSSREKGREMIKLLEAGCWWSPETEQGRARARGGRWKLPPRRPGGGEEKEGFGGNEGDLKSRPAAALHLLSSPRRAALCCPLLPPAAPCRPRPGTHHGPAHYGPARHPLPPERWGN